MRYGAGLAALVLVLGACSDTHSPVGVASATTEEPRVAVLTDAGYVRTDLGTLGGARSYAADINNRGTVVGWSETASGEVHAFRWTEGRGMVDLGTLPGHTSSQAVAVLDAWMPGGGQVLGVSRGAGGWVPVMWTVSGSIRPLSIPLLEGATYTFPADANAFGTVVGWTDVGLQRAVAWSPYMGTYDLTGNAPELGYEGAAFGVTELGRVGVTTQAFGACGFMITACWRTYLWSAVSGYQSLGTPMGNPEVAVIGYDVSDLGTVAGSYIGTDFVARPYRWRSGTGFVELPTGDGMGGGYASAVNNRGVVAGRVMDNATFTMVPVLWPTSGGVASLASGDPNFAMPLAINDGGTVAGWAVVGDGVEHAVVWRAGGAAAGSVRAQRMAEAPRRFAPSPAAECLTRPEGGTTRQALFACMMAPRGR